MHLSKRRNKSHTLLSYEALFRVLIRDYRNNQAFIHDYQKYAAGYHGEKMLDYQLSLFPQNDFYHLADIRLQHADSFFQIDSFILTPKVIFIIEIKNLRGTLEYNAHQKQIIQYVEDKQTSYLDPIIQAKIQKRKLDLWLKKRGYQIPIEYLIVSTNTSTVIRNPWNDSEFNDRFITLHYLLFRLEERYAQYTKNILSSRDIQHLEKTILQEDVPLKVDLRRKYHLNENHFISGVPCTQCYHSPLIWKSAKWNCLKCGWKSRHAHKRLILDYFLLFEPFISNSTFRDFANIRNPRLAYRLLNSMQLEKTGGKKNRIYVAPSLEKFPQNDLPDLITQKINLHDRLRLIKRNLFVSSSKHCI